MKTLNPPKFLIYMVIRAVRHPRTPISYYYCQKCKVRFPASSRECPKCHDKVGESPDPKQESPMPWYGSVAVILIGVGAAIASGILSIVWLQEISRVLIYIPMGSLFGMSLQR
ncbi:unnamed protein product [marine sediment metagenome]|uniref:Uncharacterized protein n=1 Tax=marine sediment metagenome TaxID=412755 RepID=X1QDD8_9ZZZZ